MASKQDLRAQKKREKDRKKRDQARRSRGSRPGPQAPSLERRGLPAAECAGWPLGECYLSHHWHEHGPRVQAVFTRMHQDGRVAAVFCGIDLRSEGIVDVMYRAPVTAEGVLGEVARRSEEAGEEPIQVDDALRVAKVIEAGLQLGSDAEGVADVRALLGDLDTRACPDVVLTGEPPPAPEKKKSLFSMLFGN